MARKLSTEAIGEIGENIVINELLWHGWVPVNANGRFRRAPNIDIVAAKKNRSIHLQVKTSIDRSTVRVGHGRKERYFNLKEGPKAHFIVFLRLFGPKDYECYLVPASVAEAEVRRGYDVWEKTPKRDKTVRKAFPASIYFAPNRNRPNESGFQKKWERYLNAWSQLDKN
jgi:hypothetical protein